MCVVEYKIHIMHASTKRCWCMLLSVTCMKWYGNRSQYVSLSRYCEVLLFSGFQEKATEFHMGNGNRTYEICWSSLHHSSLSKNDKSISSWHHNFLLMRYGEEIDCFFRWNINKTNPSPQSGSSVLLQLTQTVAESTFNVYTHDADSEDETHATYRWCRCATISARCSYIMTLNSPSGGRRSRAVWKYK